MGRHLKLCQHKNSVETLKIEFQRDFPNLDSAGIENKIGKARTSWEKACEATKALVVKREESKGEISNSTRRQIDGRGRHYGRSLSSK
jgi:hypothetical protein